MNIPSYAMRPFYPYLRSLMFRIEPEQAHALTLTAMRLIGNLPPVGELVMHWADVPHKPVKAFGLTFTNPVGLAAGYDKDGLGWRGLAYLGFGHIEVGTVTPIPQEGNPKPRLFRMLEEKALINRMGFPGRGADFVVRQLWSERPTGTLLGVNLGMNRDTPLEEAEQDYLKLMRTFSPQADFLVINVSSPNTVGLRRLQAREALDRLLSSLARERQEQQRNRGFWVPILVKLSPDLYDDELDDALDVILRNGMDGVIATNTTIKRKGIRSAVALEPGGLSGSPLRKLSTEMVRKITKRTAGKLPVIGVGGVMTAEDAQEKLDAGAVMVQVYTGLIYEGPGIVGKIVRGLR
jgi:dihydroorotate dehydrogenase